MRMPDVGKDKDTDLRLCQDGFGTIKKARPSEIVGLGWGAGILNSLI